MAEKNGFLKVWDILFVDILFGVSDIVGHSGVLTGQKYYIVFDIHKHFPLWWEVQVYGKLRVLHSQILRNQDIWVRKYQRTEFLII